MKHIHLTIPVPEWSDIRPLVVSTGKALGRLAVLIGQWLWVGLQLAGHFGLIALKGLGRGLLMLGKGIWGGVVGFVNSFRPEEDGDDDEPVRLSSRRRQTREEAQGGDSPWDEASSQQSTGHGYSAAAKGIPPVRTDMELDDDDDDDDDEAFEAGLFGGKL